MKKDYIKPLIEISYFSSKDVLMVSGQTIFDWNNENWDDNNDDNYD